MQTVSSFLISKYLKISVFAALANVLWCYGQKDDVSLRQGVQYGFNLLYCYCWLRYHVEALFDEARLFDGRFSFYQQSTTHLTG